MITNRAIYRAIDYIFQHIEEEIRLDDVAGHCHFSRYHFCRLFKAQTGESVYGFIKRIRLQNSAFRLKVEKERSITEISADYGYSASNYSSAFRQYYHMAPITFRRKSSQRSMEHPFFHHEEWHAGSFEECSPKITVERVPNYRVICERHFGSYEKLSRNWDKFIHKYEKYITRETRFLERTYDDPAVAEEERCLCDICMSVDEDYPWDDTYVIEGGKCAVYHFQGHAKHIYAAYQTIFLVWLPRTGYEMDMSRNPFDVYHVVDSGDMYMELDICLPVKEKRAV